MLRTFTEELQAEHPDELKYLSYMEINNKTWKRLFLFPDKCAGDSELEKTQVREKIGGSYTIYG